MEFQHKRIKIYRKLNVRATSGEIQLGLSTGHNHVTQFTSICRLIIFNHFYHIFWAAPRNLRNASEIERRHKSYSVVLHFTLKANVPNVPGNKNMGCVTLGNNPPAIIDSLMR